jgi:predicted dehydrogenase
MSEKTEHQLLVPDVKRRDFLKSSAIASTTLAAATGLVPQVHAQGNETITLGLIGCGGRGTGAISQLLNHKSDVKLVGVCDAFKDKCEGTVNRLAKNKNYKDKIDVTPDKMFTGFDGYKKLIATKPDVIVIATPPGFRPIHVHHAISEGRHVFMEKPVAVDAPGVRMILDATKMATEKNLLLQVGLQRRHEPQYNETVKRIQDGQIGDLLYMRAFWNGGGVWTRPRADLAKLLGREPTEMEYQMRNWYYFNWLCGDHICEQHIHNLDVINWIKGSYPVEANAQGGRQVRTGKEHGEIYDHHFVEYLYEDGSRMYSQCRHIRNCFNSVSEHVYGTKGSSDVNRSIITGDTNWRFSGKRLGGHQQEQLDLIDALRAGERPNEGEYGAKSTMTSIFGRMASYSGKKISWDDAINSNISIMPKSFAWDATPPTVPDGEGNYPIPMPGITKTV